MNGGEEVFNEDAFPEDFNAPSFDAVQGDDFFVGLEGGDEFIVGVVFLCVDESCYFEVVGCFVDVLWSFDGVFSEVVD